MAHSAIMSVRITGNADDAVKAFEKTTTKAAAFGSAIGGTLSYRWRAGRPTLTQEATLTALRPLLTKRITWADLPTLSWQQLDLHICDLSMIQIIDTSSPTAEKEGTQ